MTKLYEANDHVLIHAEYGNPIQHHHMAAHVIISMEENMQVVSSDTQFICRGILLPSGCVHYVDTYGKPALVFLFDCTTPKALQIKTITPIEDSVCCQIVAAYLEISQNPTAENYNYFQTKLTSLLGLEATHSSISDNRIETAIEYIRTAISEHSTCKNVADAVFLSESRFSHLFKEQTGMTFASYLIYQRLMFVYAAVVQGLSITDAALDAGFSSSAHFADVNRRVFGISASNITRDLTFIKIS